MAEMPAIETIHRYPAAGLFPGRRILLILPEPSGGFSQFCVTPARCQTTAPEMERGAFA